MLTYFVKLIFSWLLIMVSFANPVQELTQTNEECTIKCCVVDPVECAKQKCVPANQECILKAADLKLIDNPQKSCATLCRNKQ